MIQVKLPVMEHMDETTNATVHCDETWHPLVPVGSASFSVDAFLDRPSSRHQSALTL